MLQTKPDYFWVDIKNGCVMQSWIKVYNQESWINLEQCEKISSCLWLILIQDMKVAVNQPIVDYSQLNMKYLQIWKQCHKQWSKTHKTTHLSILKLEFWNSYLSIKGQAKLNVYPPKANGSAELICSIRKYEPNSMYIPLRQI